MMFSKRIRLCSFFLLLIFVGYAQRPLGRSHKDEQEIRFDTSGKMISFPSVYITSSTKLIFTVVAPKDYFQYQLQQIRKNLEKARDYINNEPGVSEAYRCFLTNSEYTLFNTSLSALISKIKGTNICSQPERDTLKKMARESNLDTLIPVSAYIDNILDKQYAVEVYRGNICIATLELYPDLSNCESPLPCITFKAKSDKKINELACKNCGEAPGDRLGFRLIHNDPMLKTIRDYYQQKATVFNEDIQRTGNGVKSIIEGLDSVANTSSANAYNSGIDDLKNIRKWFVFWFWFNGGRLTMDPFNQLTAGGREIINDLIKKDDEKSNTLKEVLDFQETARKKVDPVIANTSAMNNIQQTQQTIRKQIDDVAAHKSKLQKSLEPDPLAAKLKEKTVSYQGELRLSTYNHGFIPETVYPHKQFNASTDYHQVPLKFFLRPRVQEVPENERVQVVVHNIPAGYEVKMDEQNLAFNDQEQFTTLLMEQLSKLDIPGITAGNLQPVTDILSSMAGRISSPGIKGTTPDAPSGSSCGKIRPFIVKLYESLQAGIAFPVDPDLFEQRVSSTPVFHSKLMPITIESQEAFKDSITIKRFRLDGTGSDTVVGKTYVKVGKLRHVMIAAGFAFTANPVSTTNIDTAGGFKISSADNKARAIVGLKFYPLKNYNRDHGIIPRYFLRRFSVFGGFDVLKPLQNFYAGGAYDIVPGLGFSAGWNFYQQTRYKIQNNVITNTSRSYQTSGAYYAIVVNPILLAEIIKKFFK